MRDFRDNLLRSWTIAVTATSVERVRAAVGVDLLKIVEPGNELLRQLDDPIVLVSVIHALCRPAADAAGVTAEQFGEGMGGEAIDAAAEALLEELAGFFRKDRRPALQALVRKINAAMDQAGRRALQTIESLDLATIVDDAFSTPPPSAEKSGAALESSASIPAP